MLGLEGATPGHYHLLYPLGLGGMSEVYLAHDEQLDRDVAIKVVPRSKTEHVKRFQREIEALTALKHDHILPALDYGEQGGLLYGHGYHRCFTLILANVWPLRHWWHSFCCFSLLFRSASLRTIAVIIHRRTR